VTIVLRNPRSLLLSGIHYTFVFRNPRSLLLSGIHYTFVFGTQHLTFWMQSRDVNRLFDLNLAFITGTLCFRYSPNLKIITLSFLKQTIDRIVCSLSACDSLRMISVDLLSFQGNVNGSN